MVVISHTDVLGPFIVRAEATADNTSIRVLWKWLCQGMPLHINLVRVHYQPEGGSLMMYTVNSTTATSATLPNLQCNTKYTIWVYARGGQINRTSVPRMVSLPARGMYIIPILFCSLLYNRLYYISSQTLPLLLRSLLRSKMPQVSG